MDSKHRKRVTLGHPLVVGTVGTVLLLGWHMHALLSDIPRERVAAYAPQTLLPAPPDPLAAAPAVPSARPHRTAAAPAAADKQGMLLAATPAPAPALSLPAPPLAGGSAAPVRGPQWQQGPLPAFSPELVQAMMDPRAARRARRLRRLGITLPADPAAAVPRSGPPARPAPADQRKAKQIVTAPTVAERLAVPAGGHALPAPGSASPEVAAATRIARLDRTKPARTEPASGAPAATVTDSAKADPAKPAAGEAGSVEGKPAEESGNGESGKKEAAAPPPVAGPPVRLQARVDPPRPAYRVGEWVALRFLASRPVHLRVYRVDAAGRVTRVFSTYSRDEAGSPARTFSMMVKAGEPKPGQEGMIAIGSTRPLTHDELVSCLRASIAGPPAGPAPAPAAADAAAPADALKAVIDAVGRAADTPETAPAPLDRSGWSVAIGQFTSAARKLSGEHDPPALDRQSAVPGLSRFLLQGSAKERKRERDRAL